MADVWIDAAEVRLLTQQTVCEGCLGCDFRVENPRRACAGGLVVLSICGCLSVLTSGASVRPENTVTYLAGNRGQKGFL